MNKNVSGLARPDPCWPEHKKKVTIWPVIQLNAPVSRHLNQHRDNKDHLILFRVKWVLGSIMPVMFLFWKQKWDKMLKLEGKYIYILI